MADGRLDFEIAEDLETGLITGHAGIPSLIAAFRWTGTAAVIDREVKVKQPHLTPRPRRALLTTRMGRHWRNMAAGP